MCNHDLNVYQRYCSTYHERVLFTRSSGTSTCTRRWWSTYKPGIRRCCLPLNRNLIIPANALALLQPFHSLYCTSLPLAVLLYTTYIRTRLLAVYSICTLVVNVAACRFHFSDCWANVSSAQYISIFCCNNSSIICIQESWMQCEYCMYAS